MSHHTPDLPLQKLQEIDRTVRSEMTLEEISNRLAALAMQAFLLRTSGKEPVVGVIDDHVRAIAANAVETYRLKAKMNAMLFYQNQSFTQTLH